MAVNPINVGTVPNDDTGDSLRNAFIKVNSNEAFLETGQTTGAAITGGTINGTTIGATTATTGKFTSLGITTFGSAAAPSVAFGNDTGWFESADNDFRLTLGGTSRWRFVFSLFQGEAAGAPLLQNIDSTATEPNICPDKADANTGIGRAGEGQLSLISDGVEGLRLSETGGAVNAAFDNNILANVVEVGSFTVATLPSASATPNGIIKVSDETGGETLAFSDGTNFRRVQDRAIVA